MTLSEQQLVSWTQPSSDHEEAMCDRSARMIRQALSDSSELRNRGYLVIPQGSYHNNTNVRLSSDVDICVVFTDVCINNFTYAEGWNYQRLGYVSSDRVFNDDRELIGRALRQSFGASGIKEGGKAYEVLENSGTRVGSDVVPAWRFHGWSSESPLITPEQRVGVTFWSRDGKQVVNFPEQHHERGKAKNQRTGLAFKRAARILKRIRYDMIDRNEPVADGVSSFTLESAMYNVPDKIFDQSTWRGIMADALYYMDDALYQGIAQQQWVEVSGLKWMFQPSYGIPSNWNPKNLRTFVQAARKLVG